ncbi:uncharacterized protein SPPG_03207 [Spizellomyces punctatus DAOM BR117]|uniref:SLC41A/MgtE integral membrane domain-containing protein n=1 Tax=Spizellomyces punctatus (strain DAOM BR117) TaxID=645134 RepID=A0A0L0HJV1_SPIPD|nr:uncharacterized protein SPPG_03207 [Spizellomyces punctatus DAOM BR117]KND01397.1 hypothetical protein SPPG_03207 [Spizellomyces punctatus DAOM BR117]|eukprot:XP_016609436.1 hypothetical protein SPPG_03207 [Spizellomyces punctatus DAOM BR117]
MSSSRFFGNDGGSYVALNPLSRTSRSPSPQSDFDDPLVFATFSGAEANARRTHTKHVRRRSAEPLTISTSKTFVPLRRSLEVEEDGDIEEDGLGHDEGTAVVSLLTGATSPRRFGSDSREKRGAEQLPEQEFLNLILHQANLDDAQELCRARLDYLLKTDDARKLQRTPFYKVALYRSPAILTTLLLEMLVGAIVSSYADVLDRHILLTAFTPVLSSMSGNIGLQASTTTLRALATGHASNSDWQDVMRVMLKEFFSALVIAVVSCFALIGIGLAWSKSLSFALVTGFSILISSSFGGIVGCLGPMLFKKLGVDPALTAGPFETAVQDMVAYSAYLGLASKFLPGPVNTTSD